MYNKKDNSKKKKERKMAEIPQYSNQQKNVIKINEMQG